MYNLNANEILLVDGGGDGGSLKKKAVKEFVKLIGGDYLLNIGSGNYNNHSGIGTGTSQTYGGNGLSVGGQMMGAGRSY